jgi:hypothetical protein
MDLLTELMAKCRERKRKWPCAVYIRDHQPAVVVTHYFD